MKEIIWNKTQKRYILLKCLVTMTLLSVMLVNTASANITHISSTPGTPCVKASFGLTITVDDDPVENLGSARLEFDNKSYESQPISGSKITFTDLVSSKPGSIPFNLTIYAINGKDTINKSPYIGNITIAECKKASISSPRTSQIVSPGDTAIFNLITSLVEPIDPSNSITISYSVTSAPNSWSSLSQSSVKLNSSDPFYETLNINVPLFYPEITSHSK
jgi:hypothetical protein